MTNKKSMSTFHSLGMRWRIELSLQTFVLHLQSFVVLIPEVLGLHSIIDLGNNAQE